MVDQSPHLTVESVTRRFGDVTALDAVSMHIERGQIACLVGHSGCGKSTLLRTVAGVEAIDGGSITIGGKTVCSSEVFIEPEHRSVGLMFQDYALFPHLTARQNIGFGLARSSRAERSARVEDIIARLGIENLADRFPHMLSGGEQQRIALARALAPQPDVLLMDEPFSNLDRSLREVVRSETISLVRALGITAIVVTHDPEEALAVGDVVVLMDRGRVVEAGPGDTIYRAPHTPYAASFFSRINRIPAQREGDVVRSVFGTFPAPQEINGDVEIFVRPQSFKLNGGGAPAKVVRRSLLGEIEELALQVDGLDDFVVMRTSVHQPVNVGDTVLLGVEAGEVMVFPVRPQN
jgi:iron(III) transport system ATP-binding protein